MTVSVEPQPTKYGKRWTRKEWEKTHKPTCNVYPCSRWMEVHWHLDTRKATPKAAIQELGDGEK